jgi:hypothetical protein
MPFRVRDLTPAGKFCHYLQLEAIERIIPLADIQAVLTEHGAQATRVRKLTMEVVVLWLIALNLYAEASLGYVFEKMSHSLRLLWPDEPCPLPRASALVYRRYQLRVRSLAALFHRICRPLATEQTPGAFLYGLRLMALDGHVEPVPDTRANEACFGRGGGQRGPAAFPQVRIVSLCECGTHAVVDATFWPVHTGEITGAHRLLRSVTAGMLVLWDRGFYQYDLIQAIRTCGAHMLGRITNSIAPRFHQALPDGSYLAWIRPQKGQREGRGRMLVRIIEYTLDDPRRPGHRERHRLLTTLLDAQAAPAGELVLAYHERWEFELMVDEVTTHQLAGDRRPLRSQKPVGVVQELYALLLAHYAVRALIHAAAQEAGVDPDRIGFLRTLRLVRDAVGDFQLAAREWHGHLYARLLRAVSRELLPPRRLRLNPRVVKRKMSNFPLKREKHRNWPQPFLPFEQIVRLIAPPTSGSSGAI